MYTLTFDILFGSNPIAFSSVSVITSLPPPIKFGLNVQKARKAKKLSQNALADILDISREHLAKIETGKRRISLKLLFLLSEVLEVPESELMCFIP